MTIFERIANHEIPANIVYEDDEIIAFLDIEPINAGHVLVLPKKCYETINNLPEELAARLFQIVTRLSKKVFEVLKPDGINIISNNKPAAGQSVPHIHIHIIPRYINDGFKISSSHVKLTVEEFEAIKNKLLI